MTTLETELQNLRKQLDDVAKRVRLDAVAKEFLAQKVEYREGDVINRNGFIEQIHTIRSPEKCGKPYALWGVSSMTGRSYEGPAPDDLDHPSTLERYYTHAEVAEIVAKATTIKATELSAEVLDAVTTNPTIVRMVRALKDISNSTNPEYTIRRAREALGL